MDEAEQLCDRLVVMDHGRIAAEGSPRELIERYSTREVLEIRFAPDGEDREAAASALGTLVGTGERGSIERIEELPDRILLYSDHGEASLAAVNGAGIVPLASLVRRSSLEDVFLHLTGRTLVD
jgi:lipooligosaccharide transport system ATP-binding protein